MLQSLGYVLSEILTSCLIAIIKHALKMHLKSVRRYMKDPKDLQEILLPTALMEKWLFLPQHKANSLHQQSRLSVPRLSKKKKKYKKNYKEFKKWFMGKLMHFAFENVSVIFSGYTIVERPIRIFCQSRVTFPWHSVLSKQTWNCRSSTHIKCLGCD